MNKNPGTFIAFILLYILVLIFNKVQSDAIEGLIETTAEQSKTIAKLQQRTMMPAELKWVRERMRWEEESRRAAEKGYLPALDGMGLAK